MSTPGGRAVGPLAGLLRRGAAASGAALVVVQTISFLQVLVLARLLTPAEVGVFAAGTVLTLFLATFAEGALTQALMQRPEEDHADAADTVFRATLATGVLLALITLALSPVVAMVVGDPVAGQVAAVTSGALVLHAFTNVPDALMQRRFDFRRRLIIDPAVTLAFAVVAVPLAAAGFGVWSLVVATYVQMVVWVTASWCLGSWRPGRGSASVRMWRELARYGFPLLLGSAAERVREAAEVLLVGRYIDTAALGFYRYGKRLALLPGVAVIQVGAFVLFPAFARIAGDPPRLAAAFLRASRWIMVLAVPVSAVLVVLGEPLAVVLLGERWREAGVALTAMAGIGVGQALTAVAAEALKGVGRTERLNAMTAVGVVLGVGLVVAMLPLGLVGVGLAMSVTAIAIGFAGVWQVSRTLEVRAREVLGDVLRPLVAVVPGALLATALNAYVLHAEGLPPGLDALALLAAVVAFTVCYLVLLRVVHPAVGRPIFATIKRFLPG